MASRPDSILANVIANRAEALPDLKVLTIDGGGVRPDDVRTFRQLWDNAQPMAGALVGQALQPGQHFPPLIGKHAEVRQERVAGSRRGPRIYPNGRPSNGG